MGCDNCPLLGRAKVSGFGPPGGILILGEAPGYTEAMKGRPFVGESGQLLRSTLQQAGFSGEEVHFTNAVLCHPAGNETPSLAAIACCRDRLLQEIELCNPKKILTVGAIGLQALTQQPSVAITKERSIGREIILDKPYYVLPTFHPAAVLRVTEYFRDFATDIKKFSEHDAPIPFPRILYQICETVEEAYEALTALRSASMLSCDLETTGRDPLTCEIEEIGFGALIDDPDFDSYSLIISKGLMDLMPRAILSFLTEYEGKLAFHNLKFDLQFLERYYNQRIRFRDPWDTMLMAYALDERAGRESDTGLSRGFPIHGLKSLSRRYDIRDYHFNFDEFYSVPREERDYDKLRTYHGIDLHVTVSLLRDLLIELEAESPRLIQLVKEILVPGTIMYGEVELNGTMLDRYYLEEFQFQLEQELQSKLDLLQDKARELGVHQDAVPFDIYKWSDVQKLLLCYPRMKEYITNLVVKARLAHALGYEETRTINRVLNLARPFNLFSEGKFFNPNSSVMAKKFLSNLGVTSDSTERESLWLAMSQQKTPKEVREIVDVLIDYRLKSKILSTFVIGLQRALDPNDRVHMDYLLHGTATGRPACQNPNVQNIPQVMGKEIRHAFIARASWEYLIFDFSQLELRVVAHLAADEKMIEAYRLGRDIHREVASAMFGKPPEEISYFERYLAKYVDFGLIYGRSARSLVEGWEMEYLAQQGGERWTQKQAETFIEKFLGQFPQLKAWLANQERLVHSQHYIETLTGRRRRFPLITPQTRGSAERQARNSPIQSFASDINLSAMIKLHDLLDPREARILYSVYDSISFEIREDVLEKNIDVIKAVMEKPPIPLLVPLRVDVEVGPRWSETKPWEEVKDAYNRMVA